MVKDYFNHDLHRKRVMKLRKCVASTLSPVWGTPCPGFFWGGGTPLFYPVYPSHPPGKIWDRTGPWGTPCWRPVICEQTYLETKKFLFGS